MKFMFLLIFTNLLLFINSIWLLMSETLLLGYAQVIGIFALGAFTVIWNSRRKKESVEIKKTVEQVKEKVAEVTGTVDIVHKTINHMRDLELKQTKELGEKVGAETGRLQKRAEDREDKIDNISLAPAPPEPPPVKVVIAEPADVKIVEDKTKEKDK